MRNKKIQILARICFGNRTFRSDFSIGDTGEKKQMESLKRVAGNVQGV